jgi:hypothetical protein
MSGRSSGRSSGRRGSADSMFDGLDLYQDYDEDEFAGMLEAVHDAGDAGYASDASTVVSMTPSTPSSDIGSPSPQHTGMALPPPPPAGSIEMRRTPSDEVWHAQVGAAAAGVEGELGQLDLGAMGGGAAAAAAPSAPVAVAASSSSSSAAAGGPGAGAPPAPPPGGAGGGGGAGWRRCTGVLTA